MPEESAVEEPVRPMTEAEILRVRLEHVEDELKYRNSIMAAESLGLVCVLMWFFLTILFFVVGGFSLIFCRSALAFILCLSGGYLLFFRSK